MNATIFGWMVFIFALNIIICEKHPDNRFFPPIFMLLEVWLLITVSGGLELYYGGQLMDLVDLSTITGVDLQTIMNVIMFGIVAFALVIISFMYNMHLAFHQYNENKEKLKQKR